MKGGRERSRSIPCDASRIEVVVPFGTNDCSRQGLHPERYGDSVLLVDAIRGCAARCLFDSASSPKRKLNCCEGLVMTSIGSGSRSRDETEPRSGPSDASADTRSEKRRANRSLAARRSRRSASGRCCEPFPPVAPYGRASIGGMPAAPGE